MNAAPTLREAAYAAIVPVSHAVGTSRLAGATLPAAAISARRAARIDPIMALRAEWCARRGT